MELFKLLGTVAIDCSGANNAIDEVTDKAQKSESKIGNAFSKIGSAAVETGKVVATGYAAVSAGVAALTKTAIEGYADYEQLVGGVETLFGSGGQSLEEYAESVGKTVEEVRDEYDSLMKAQKTVMDNADKAYSTAGMSANEYMETVTSFSASLIQSLNGDTEAAAEKADRAIVDMSDNANKMGSSMESIQNAYQGFAKQNYTMLDNLKLGYGGTQEEMKRLLADAQAISGIEYDISSYADIVDAIHVIQEEMGIAGTTAKEASSTITGSVESAKSAWSNLMVGLANEDADLSGLMSQFVNSVGTAVENIVPRIGVIKDSIVVAAEDLFGRFFDYVSIGVLKTQVTYEEVSTKIKTVVSEVKESAISILKSGFEWIQSTAVPAISSIWQGIKDGYAVVQPVFSEAIGKITDLTEQVIGIATELFGMFSSKFGEVGEMFSKIAEEVIKPFYEVYLGSLIATFENLVEIWETVLLPVIQIVIDAFMSVVTSVYENVAPAIKTIMDKFGELAGLIQQAINEYIMPVIQAFLGIIMELYEENKEKLDLIGELFGAIFGWISERVSKFVEDFKNTFMPFLELIKNFVMENLDKIKEIFQHAIDFVTGIVQFFIALFKGDWAGMWEAIKSTLTAAVEFINGIFETLKEFLGTIFSKIVENVSAKFDEIRSKMEEKVQAAKNKVMEVFESISGGISEKINAAKEAVSNAIEKIKGFFNFNVSLPDIKLPHFSIQPSGWELGDLLEGSIPSLGIEWYAKGGVMEKPTVFGMNGNNAMIGGEAGPEAVAPIDVLQGYVAQAVASQNAALIAVLQKILDAILSMREGMKEDFIEALEQMRFELNNREFARLVKAVN